MPPARVPVWLQDRRDDDGNPIRHRGDYGGKAIRPFHDDELIVERQVRERPRSRSRSRVRTRSVDGWPGAVVKRRAIRERQGPIGPLVSVDPAFPQDVTLHLSLPVKDDLEDVLEEAARLRRLGHFSDAIALFTGTLGHFLDNRYVLVQYAQCLYEAGQYVQLGKLAEERPLRPLNHPDALELNWNLLLAAAGQGSFKNPLDDDDTTHFIAEIMTMVANSWPRIDSTECQVLSLLPHIGCKLEAVLPPHRLRALYRSFISRGMVWELSDLLHGDLAHTMPLKVLISLARSMPLRSFPDKSRSATLSCLRELRDVLTEGNEDEPTLFALLDMFTTLALQCRKRLSSNVRTWEHVMHESMEAADECASALLGLDEANHITRPCLRWTVAKQMIRDDNERLFLDQLSPRDSSRAPDGEFYNFNFSRCVFPTDHLPVYDASNGAIPEWKPKLAAAASDFEPVAKMVLQAAEELGDMDLRTGCLKEMMYRGIQPPESVLAKLREIWLTTGNKRMLWSLNLFRALLPHSHTPLGRQELQRELLHEIETGTSRQVLDRVHYLATLSLDPTQSEAYRRLAGPTGYRDDLSSTSSDEDSYESDGGSIRGAWRNTTGYRVLDVGSRPRGVRTTYHHPGRIAVPGEVVVRERPRPPPPPAALPPAVNTRHGDENRSAPPAPPAKPAPPETPRTTKPSVRGQLAKIKAEAKDIEQQISAAQERGDRRDLHFLQHRLEELGVERYRLEMERRKKKEYKQQKAAGNLSVPDDQHRRLRDAADDPLTKGPQRRTTVEDYSGSSSDVDGKSDEGQEHEVDVRERKETGRVKKMPLLLEYPGYGHDAES